MVAVIEFRKKNAVSDILPTQVCKEFCVRAACSEKPVAGLKIGVDQILPIRRKAHLFNIFEVTQEQARLLGLAVCKSAATDDGNGNLTGTGIAAGTINYSTGAVSITYSAAPANSQAITMGYNYANPSSSLLTMGVDQMPTLVAESVVVILA